MPNWIQDSGERLVKLETSHKKELELSSNIMEATLEDQHSHQDNPNAFRSMRDRMHPPRMSAPSCIVPPTEQLGIRQHIVPLLPTFHGMESEIPYAHIKEFEDVCNTFQEGGASIDLMRLKLFPFTLKDKAKIWLNSLRPKRIRTWTDLQAEFLKKFFLTQRTNGLKRQISNFSAKENEKFYECWERYMEAINACPHHGFDTWLLEAMDFLSYVVEVSRAWDEPNKGDMGKTKSQPNTFNVKAGMYTLNEDIDMKAKVAAVTRRLEELELKKIHEVAPQYTQPTQASQQASNLEQAIVNLSKVVEDFVGDQKSINAQLSQRIDSVENTLNKRMDGMQNDLSQKIDNLQYSISRLTNLNTVQEKGRFPSQPHQNPKGIHEVETHEGESSQVSDVKALITLRSGKRLSCQHPSHMLRKRKKNKRQKRGRKSKERRKGLNVNKKAFLTEQVSVIIQCKSPLKYKEPGCPTVSVMIGGTIVEKALLDLGASVNLLPYSVYKQFGLGELKPTSITLSLADRSVKIPRAIIEDVLVQVDNFYYSSRLCCS
ncbi:hypothetical protein CK203_048023 [Vitis vinifera]|uniref:Retrotransposon gag domain-containing protein n=1 Tax=Vitis vinifera TaxID=29760 RepID=A0A438GZN5_VITVI|nr:hypothetical protein CK203_048023 [Vitis vinifera]